MSNKRQMMQNEYGAKRPYSSAQRTADMESEVPGRKVHFKLHINPRDIGGEMLSPIGNLLQCIRTYFAQFGELVSAHIWARMKSLELIIGIIKFQREEDAKKVLQCRPHVVHVGQVQVYSWVDDGLFFLEPRNPRVFGTMYKKLAESVIDSYSGVNILDLDDDCIQEVFDYLNAVDLCSVAAVCQRFKAAAQKQLGFNHASLHFVEIAAWNRDRMITFMQNFGPFIEKVDVSKYLLPKSIHFSFPHMLVGHFRSIRELRLHHFTMNDAVVAALRPIFVRLENLCLHECRVSNALCEVLADCNELIEIKITMANVKEFNLRPVHLRKLESFSFSAVEEWPVIQNLPIFLERNPQLRKIALKIGLSSNEFSEVIRTIAQLEHVESLKFVWTSQYLWEGDNDHIPLQALARIKKLRKLKLPGRFPASSIIELLNALASAEIPLEHFQIGSFEYNSLICTAVSKFKLLKVLSLCNVSLKENDLVHTCENLPELTHLHVNFEVGNEWDPYFLPELLSKGKKWQQIRLENYETPIPVVVYEQLLEIAKDRLSRIPLQIFADIETFEELKNVTSTLDANANILRISHNYDE